MSLRSSAFSLTLIVACGGGTAGTSSAEPALHPSSSCAAPATGGACSDLNGCCSIAYDGHPAEHYRCDGAKFVADDACGPSKPACKQPLSGSLLRADGKELRVPCVSTRDRPSATTFPLDVEGYLPGTLLEVVFDRVPAAGEVVDVAAYDEEQAEAGTPNRARLRIGRYGLGMFEAAAKSVSGKLTVTSIEATTTGITSLRASVDATTTGLPDWEGKLAGSW